MTVIRKLSGHSGCIVYLCENDETGEAYIRKVSGDSKYNHRLERQCKKQIWLQGSLKNFHSTNGRNLFTPKVLSTGEINGNFYFDMEYVRAQTFAEYLCTAKIFSLVDIVSTILEFFLFEISHSKQNLDSNYIFRQKIETIKFSPELLEPEVVQCLEILKNHDFGNLMEGDCLGDLTLENILISPSGDIWLIDLLDSFYESWVMDVSKLLMDLKAGWSWRLQRNDSNRNLRAYIVKQMILEFIASLPVMKGKSTNLIYLQLLHALRILPYTHDSLSREIILKFIKDTLKEVM